MWQTLLCNGTVLFEELFCAGGDFSKLDSIKSVVICMFEETLCFKMLAFDFISVNTQENLTVKRDTAF